MNVSFPNISLNVLCSLNVCYINKKIYFLLNTTNFTLVKHQYIYLESLVEPAREGRQPGPVPRRSLLTDSLLYGQGINTRDEDPTFYSEDPDPAQLKKKIRIPPSIEMKK